MDEELAPAAFSDRLVAYAVDLGLILLAYYAVSLAMVYGAPALMEKPAVSVLWRYVFFAFYVAYHAVLSAGGRRTPGKALMGVRVIAGDGSEPSLPRALGRAAASLLSTAAIGLGFLWALGPAKSAWHDRLARTRVVETRAKSGAARGLITAGAWGLALLMLAGWLFVLVIAPGYAQRQLVANAQLGLQSMARLEHAYHEQNGAYAPDLDSLLKATGHAEEFKTELAKIIDMSSLKVEGGKDSYLVEAAALDDHRTVITIRSAQ